MFGIIALAILAPLTLALAIAYVRVSLGAPVDTSQDVTTKEDRDDDGPLYDLECSHCGRALEPVTGRDETGSTRCDDLDPEHKRHRVDLADEDPEVTG